MGKKVITIAVLMGDKNMELTHELLRGLYSCAQKEKVNLVFLVCSSIPRATNYILSDMTGNDFQVHFSSIFDYVPLFKPDVLICGYGTLSTSAVAPELEELIAFYEGIPCILLKEGLDNPKIAQLNVNNYLGMKECVEHLVADHGYKKIAFFAGPRNNRDSNERLRAYYDVMHKYGLTVEDKMIEYGDFSEHVDDLVRNFLDANPKLDAIVFANDTMARAGYRICEERGIRVGKDLAITGYDDLDMAKTMNPPLTSVRYSSFTLGYHALQQAVQLYHDKKVSHENIDTILCKRASCGCNYGYEQIEFDHIHQNEFKTNMYKYVEMMAEELFAYIPNRKVKQQYKEVLLGYFDDFLEHILQGDLERYTFDTELMYLNKLCENTYISSTILLDHMVQLLRKMASCVEDEKVRSFILRVITSTQQFVNGSEITKLRAKEQQDRNQNWFGNVFVQDLLVPQMGLEDGLTLIMKRFQSMKIKKCYFFLLSTPATGDVAFRLKQPDNLYLAAYYDEKSIVSLPREDWILINKENGVADVIPQGEYHTYSTYVLFSADEQYGFMVCENEQQDTQFVLECSLQMGAFLRFCKLNDSVQKSKHELEVSLETIKKQNLILNSISENDDLTNLFNRRGFMERIMNCIKENDGKTAYFLFADLDHLKEINDSFGHPAGDFAIITAADYLRECMPKDAITARIGGDEFVSFAIIDEKEFESRIKQDIRRKSTAFNQNSDKPYYVELSVGVSKCICSTSIEVSDLLNKSDALLYEAKKSRRESIRK